MRNFAQCALFHWSKGLAPSRMQGQKPGQPGQCGKRRDPMQSFGRTIRTTLVIGASALALSACVNTNELDWDLRGNASDTTAAARQATAPAPRADANGIISYPGYQMAAARRGETVATMAGRLGLNAGELAQANACLLYTSDAADE